MQVTEQFLHHMGGRRTGRWYRRAGTRLAIGCTATGPLVFTLPKQAWLARHRSRDRTYEDFSSEKVRGPAISQDTEAVTAHQHPRQQPGAPDPEATRATMVLDSNVGGRPLAAIHMSFIVGTRGRPTHLRPRRQPAARRRRRGMSALDGQTSLGYRPRDPGCRATGDADRPVPAVSPIAPAPSAEPVTPGRGHGAAGHRRAA